MQPTDIRSITRRPVHLLRTIACCGMAVLLASCSLAGTETPRYNTVAGGRRVPDFNPGGPKYKDPKKVDSPAYSAMASSYYVAPQAPGQPPPPMPQPTEEEGSWWDRATGWFSSSPQPMSQPYPQPQSMMMPQQGYPMPQAQGYPVQGQNLYPPQGGYNTAYSVSAPYQQASPYGIPPAGAPQAGYSAFPMQESAEFYNRQAPAGGPSEMQVAGNMQSMDLPPPPEYTGGAAQRYAPIIPVPESGALPQSMPTTRTLDPGAPYPSLSEVPPAPLSESQQKALRDAREERQELERSRYEMEQQRKAVKRFEQQDMDGLPDLAPQSGYDTEKAARDEMARAELNAAGVPMPHVITSPYTNRDLPLPERMEQIHVDSPPSVAGGSDSMVTARNATGLNDAGPPDDVNNSGFLPNSRYHRRPARSSAN